MFRIHMQIYFRATL